MKANHFAIVLIACIGIYFVANGIIELTFITYGFSKGDGSEFYRILVTKSIVQMATLVGVGTILIYYRRRMADFIIEQREQEDISVEISDLQAGGFSTIGAYFFFDGLIRFINDKVVLGNYSEMFSFSHDTVRILVGIFLFASGKRLVNIWAAFRSGGHPYKKYKEKKE